jgi:hypothetical protein
MTNEELAMIVLKNDRTARWVFNYYCTRCGRFLQPEDYSSEKCRKCKASTTDAISHVIPFSSSATAIEKLIDWVIHGSHEKRGEMVARIMSATSRWLNNDLTSLQCKQTIVDEVGSILEGQA